jgi:hypothetical protein
MYLVPGRQQRLQTARVISGQASAVMAQDSPEIYLPRALAEIADCSDYIWLGQCFPGVGKQHVLLSQVLHVWEDVDCARKSARKKIRKRDIKSYLSIR